uniref:Galectin n=1 Tax=Meloidogyne enterolobii TaxID=390850 RepID=A0A6V7WAB4_MELEN|nr:unnamed protein product [Meloidogyne enterolobii]
MLIFIFLILLITLTYNNNRRTVYNNRGTNNDNRKTETTILRATTPTKPTPFCRGRIVVNNLVIPATIDFVRLGFEQALTLIINPILLIRILGTPLAQPNYFNIHIAEPSRYINANVLFQLSTRFGEGQVKYNKCRRNFVIRNSLITGEGWVREERSGGFPFKVGQPFVLEFIATEDSIDVHVDDRFFVNFIRYNFWNTTSTTHIF